jgi:hypothetical protein
MHGPSAGQTSIVVNAVSGLFDKALNDVEFHAQRVLKG